MQMHHERIARARLVVDRIGQHPFDAHAVSALPFDLLLPRQRVVAIEIVVHAA